MAMFGELGILDTKDLPCPECKRLVHVHAKYCRNCGSVYSNELRLQRLQGYEEQKSKSYNLGIVAFSFILMIFTLAFYLWS